MEEEIITGNVGKKVFALNSMWRTPSGDIQDGYLLFKNPEKAQSIIDICERNLLVTERKYLENLKGKPFYTPAQWVFVSEFYYNQITQRGSMFVRDLKHATNSIDQSEVENILEN
jgi:hypothetical protein